MNTLIAFVVAFAAACAVFNNVTFDDDRKENWHGVWMYRVWQYRQWHVDDTTWCAARGWVYRMWSPEWRTLGSRYDWHLSVVCYVMSRFCSMCLTVVVGQMFGVLQYWDIVRRYHVARRYVMMFVVAYVIITRTPSFLIRASILNIQIKKSI